MELRHIRYFLAVVETGSTTRAASRELVAQPSLSRQLRRLEGELGIDLFARDGGRLRLSAAGERFLPIARDLVARADAARTTLRALADGRPPRLTVAAPVTTITDVIAPYIASTSADDPFITVREELPSAAYAALQTGADLAISSFPAPKGLASRPLARLPIWAYVPASHPWAALSAIPMTGLVGEPLLLLSREHGTRRLFDQAAMEENARYEAAFETSVPQIAQALAAAGHGVAVVSDDPRYDLHPLAIEGARGALSIQLYAAWDPAHYAVRSLADLAADLSGYCVTLYGPGVAP